MSCSLAVTLSGLVFKNPVLAASGTFGYGSEFKPYINLSEIGGFVVKGLSLKERPGNEPPRIVETPCGMLNAIGLQNVGVDRFISEKLPEVEDCGSHVIANIYAGSVEEFKELAERLNGTSISALEVNVSCPNVNRGGALFGKNPDDVYRLTESIKSVSDKPVIVKLTPNVTDICSVAVAAEKGGADAVSLINTITGMVIDIDSGKPVLANRMGGLSGPAIYPVGVRMVYEVYECVDIPIIGVGGINSAGIALQYIMAGASLVEVGTANFIHPDITVKIVKDLKRFCDEKGLSSICELIGCAHGD